MNVESSFFKDRPPTGEEYTELPHNLPKMSGASKYEDLFEVDVTMDFETTGSREEDFSANVKRWYFRMN